METDERNGARTGGTAPRGELGARLERLPFPAVLAGLVLFGGLALGLASIGGAAGIAAVLCLAAVMAALLIAACD